MFKLNRLGVMLLLAAFVGVAWGAATKIPSFEIQATYPDCSGGPDIEAPLFGSAADGMAILNYVLGTDTTIVQVIVSDFTGGDVDEYIVRLNPGEDVDLVDLGTFFVDSQGNGHFHGVSNGDHSVSNVELWQQAQANCPIVLIATGQ